MRDIDCLIAIADLQNLVLRLCTHSIDHKEAKAEINKIKAWIKKYENTNQSARGE